MPKRKSKPVAFLIVEGQVTEPGYFDSTRNFFLNFTLIVKNGKHSSPQFLLKKALELESKVKEHDIIAIMLDRDDWPQKDLEELEAWRKKDPKRRFVILSQPCFEISLLIHFKDPINVRNKEEICHQLKNYCNIKNIHKQQWTLEQIKQACKRSKDLCRNKNFLDYDGIYTNIYLILEILLNSNR